AVVASGTFTDWGHMTALLIGFAVGPLLRPARRREPLAVAEAAPSAPLARAWRWISTPPEPPPVARQRRLATVAAVVLLAGAATAAALAARSDTDVALPPAPDAMATVAGPARRCGHDCLEVPVRYDAPRSGTSVLHLPAGTTADIGTRVPVRPDPASPGTVRVGGQARRIDISGLLGEIAVSAAAAGLGLLLVTRHRRRVERPLAGAVPAP
ncbi:MAG TPA: hypothetical protein VHO27_07900, partial [Angustibacter sp.]|nr:hypothetical protein [Angustibacter sp.]